MQKFAVIHEYPSIGGVQTSIVMREPDRDLVLVRVDGVPEGFIDVYVTDHDGPSSVDRCIEVANRVDNLVINLHMKWADAETSIPD